MVCGGGCGTSVSGISLCRTGGVMLVVVMVVEVVVVVMVVGGVVDGGGWGTSVMNDPSPSGEVLEAAHVRLAE